MSVMLPAEAERKRRLAAYRAERRREAALAETPSEPVTVHELAVAAAHIPAVRRVSWSRRGVHVTLPWGAWPYLLRSGGDILDLASEVAQELGRGAMPGRVMDDASADPDHSDPRHAGRPGRSAGVAR